MPTISMFRGMDEKTAAYFAAGRKQIVQVTPRDDFTLVLRFDNGELRRLVSALISNPEQCLRLSGSGIISAGCI